MFQGAVLQSVSEQLFYLQLNFFYEKKKKCFCKLLGDYIQVWLCLCDKFFVFFNKKILLKLNRNHCVAGSSINCQKIKNVESINKYLKMPVICDSKKYYCFI